MSTTTQTLRLGGTVLDPSSHICAFFQNKEEEYEVLLPFIKEGIEVGDKACHIMESDHRPKHRGILNTAGIDVAGAEGTRQLDLLAWEEAYLKDGQFNKERMINLIQKLLTNNRDSGFTRTRLIANMEWVYEDEPNFEELIEYETRLNYVLPDYHDAIICTYDLARFNAVVVIDILRTHPMVIIGGLLQHNPFYVEPTEMLKELTRRKNKIAKKEMAK
jgi:hypothetical protein